MNSSLDSFFANFLPGYLIFTGIEPDDFQHTNSIHGNTLELFPTILSIRPTWMWGVQKLQERFSCHSIHGDALKLLPTILSIHSIHGDALELFPTILSIHSIHGDIR